MFTVQASHRSCTASIRLCTCVYQSGIWKIGAECPAAGSRHVQPSSQPIFTFSYAQALCRSFSRYLQTIYISGLTRITSCFNVKKEERSCLLHQSINRQLLEFYVNAQNDATRSEQPCLWFFLKTSLHLTNSKLTGHADSWTLDRHRIKANIRGRWTDVMVMTATST